jgi:hypothetical protein
MEIAKALGVIENLQKMIAPINQDVNIPPES